MVWSYGCAALGALQWLYRVNQTLASEALLFGARVGAVWRVKRHRSLTSPLRLTDIVGEDRLGPQGAPPVRLVLCQTAL